MKGAVLNLPASRPGPDVSLFPDAAHCYHCNALHLSRPVGTGAFLRKASLSPRLDQSLLPLCCHVWGLLLGPLWSVWLKYG